MYSFLVLGGTFDHLHAGHRAMLDMAFSLSKHVVIGLTTDAMITEKQALDSLQSFDERKKELENYLKETKVLDRSEIVPICDLYGTTLEDTRLEAIVVTSQTKQGARKINEERIQ